MYNHNCVLLTIRECAALIPGMTEYAVRQLVNQGKIKFIKPGVKYFVFSDSYLEAIGIDPQSIDMNIAEWKEAHYNGLH